MVNFAKPNFICTKAALPRALLRAQHALCMKALSTSLFFLLYSPQNSSSGWLLQRQMVELSNFLACEVHCIFMAAGTLFYKNLRQQVCSEQKLNIIETRIFQVNFAKAMIAYVALNFLHIETKEFLSLFFFDCFLQLFTTLTQNTSVSYLSFSLDAGFMTLAKTNSSLSRRMVFCYQNCSDRL